MDLVIRSPRVVLPEGVVPAAVAIADGRIERVAAISARIPAALEIVADRSVVMPGLVDSHVHVNDPGRGDWEGFETAGRAAAAGGTTAIVDMPLNSIPVTTTVPALEAKLAAARDRCRVDFGLWGGVVPGNRAERAALVEAGALGLKAFLVPSGIDEFPAADDDELEHAMAALARLDAPVLVHAEDAREIERAEGDLGAGGPATYARWLASRPPAAEARAVVRVADLSRRTGARAHVVHVAAADAVDEVARAKAAGVALSSETCPHYLSLAAEEAPDDARWKCAPPIRESRHREALWRGLTAGTIDFVATDHSPCPPSLKPLGDFARAWGGIAGLELRLPVVWTDARARGVGLAAIALWLAEGPARLAGLSDRKGRIARGLDADLVIWDPEREFVVDPARLHQRYGSSPWDGRTLRGVVETTILRGRIVYERGRFPGSPEGRWLQRRPPARAPLAARRSGLPGSAVRRR